MVGCGKNVLVGRGGSTGWNERGQGIEGEPILLLQIQLFWSHLASTVREQPGFALVRIYPEWVRDALSLTGSEALSFFPTHLLQHLVTESSTDGLLQHLLRLFLHAFDHAFRHWLSTVIICGCVI